MKRRTLKKREAKQRKRERLFDKRKERECCVVDIRRQVPQLDREAEAMNTCTPSTPTKVCVQIATYPGHEWVEHPKYGRNWYVCPKCRCVKLVDVQPGWGIAVSHYTDQDKSKCEPDCVKADRLCEERDEALAEAHNAGREAVCDEMRELIGAKRGWRTR